MWLALLPVCCQILCGPLLGQAACCRCFSRSACVCQFCAIPWPAKAAKLGQPFIISALVLVPLQARKPVTEGEQPQECKQQ